jgi:GT2 family glycosyltransferase
MVTGSRLLYPSGQIQHAGVAFDNLGPHHVFLGLPGDEPIVKEQRDYQVVTGAALAIRASELRRLDGFDTSYENSFEDVDLCLRVRRDRGRVVYVPSSTAYHFESMTEGRKGPTDMRNYELFMERWSDRFERDLPDIVRDAAARGVDVNGHRLPSRRVTMQVEELMRREEELLAIRRMRSVRAALWLRNAFRRIIPAR